MLETRTSFTLSVMLNCEAIAHTKLAANQRKSSDKIIRNETMHSLGEQVTNATGRYVGMSTFAVAASLCHRTQQKDCPTAAT